MASTGVLAINNQLFILMPQYSVGDELRVPDYVVPLNATNRPTITPATGFCWREPQGFNDPWKLFWEAPGTYELTWKLPDGSDHVTLASVSELPATQVFVGSEIPPPASVDIDQLALPPEFIPAGAGYWHSLSRKAYAVSAGNFSVVWGNQCPSITQRVDARWPQDPALYQTHVAGADPLQLSGWQARLYGQDEGVGAELTEVAGNDREFAARSAGRSLLMLSRGEPNETNVFFQLINSVFWDDEAYLIETNAVVGEPLPVPDVHDSMAGSPWVQNRLSRYCVQTNFWSPTNRLGPIVPINVDAPGVPEDDLVVTYYWRGSRLLDPLTGQLVDSGIGWPSQSVRYHAQWPTNAPVIYVGRAEGGGLLNPEEYQNWQIYVQNDASEAGFNPNDEHAFIGVGTNSLSTIFALRDDLGTPETSDPFVIVTYEDGLDGGRPKTKVFEVRSEPLEYPDHVAGMRVERPYPLLSLKKCEQSRGLSGPYWSDKNLDFWARAAGDDGGPAEIVMHWSYPTKPGFYFPSNYFEHFPATLVATNVPAPDSVFPWQDLRAGTPGRPWDVVYSVDWPEPCAWLAVGESLMEPKYGSQTCAGLPGIGAQTSAEVIYQQSQARGEGASVALIDPTRVITVLGVATLPADAVTFNSGGLTWFPELPPHLRSRFWYDSVTQSLNYEGLPVKPVSGEPWLLLNVLSVRDLNHLLTLSQDNNFRAKIQEVAELASGVVEVAPDEPFRDLALTAGAAQATGWVTLAFGNSAELSPANEPVVLSVFPVRCPVYRGDIVAIPSDGPFDEKLTLRHSGDFGGRPEGYIFQWRSLPPDPVTGGPQTSIPREQWSSYPMSPASGLGAQDITIEGAGLFTLADNYFVCRYRPADGVVAPCGNGWSDWTEPMLAEGWIKRVVGRINPFTQRAEGGGLEGAETRFGAFTKSVNTIVSM
ncbi:MAG: hypothetical protein ACO34E_18460, partial [Limisphaerales bacterium]